MQVVYTIFAVYMVAALVAGYYLPPADPLAFDRENVDRMRFHWGNYLEHLQQEMPFGWRAQPKLGIPSRSEAVAALSDAMTVDLGKLSKGELDAMRHRVVAQRQRLQALWEQFKD